MKIVISLGGSVMVPDEIDKEYVKKFALLARELAKKHELAIVTGGGRTARKYIEPAREYRATEYFCDRVGISATRMNAMLLSSAIGPQASIDPPRDQVEAAKEMDSKKIVVMGGTEPGHSTDAVAALLAECVKADLFINASDIDGVYDSDPKKNRDAKRLEKISAGDLLDMVKNKAMGAGKYELVDMLAVKIVQRSKIKTIFLSGRDLENMRNAIDGKKFVGTTIEGK
jgi:uridylate kinase